ncbi:unnamed protein product [Caenorhabditis auriculariae]|uniref:Adenylyltransferase and sulfurtransferase MOCS3 homolog n=1 Tax=Caenorhabditis auriculariae TaxID=2777116 RepID=A0A8S1HBM0_9PELO|nr:unnamed protein product [Caenorhabditis auriculariae]
MDDLSWTAGLTKEQAGRYSRQVLVQDFGVNGQKNASTSKVLIIGAGGLGCPTATYLAGAGIGTIGIVDYDTVSLDNLHRQVAHREQAVGTSKVESLKIMLNSLNSSIKIITHEATLNSKCAMEIVKLYDIVCDCSDNAATRYLINDVCVLLDKPLVSGSALRWDGQLTVYHYGKEGPCYRCLFPSPPDPSTVTNCSEGGVLGPVVGVIGSMQALEVLKMVAGLPCSFAGKLFLYDGRSGSTRTIVLRKRSPRCAVCGDEPSITAPIDYELFCGAGAHDKIERIWLLEQNERVSVEEYRDIRRIARPLLIDTRPPIEFEIAHLPEATNITLNDLSKLDSAQITEKLKLNATENDQKKDLFVICHRGNDSQRAVKIIKEKGNFEFLSVRDVSGGYDEWATKVNPNFPVY